MRKLTPELVNKIKLLVFDFDGVFTDNRVLVMQDGTEGVFCNRSDGLGVGMAKKAGLEVMVISKEVNPVVSARCRKLSLPCIQSCDNKAEVLTLEVNKRGISLENVAYMGNDINDLECLQIAGLPACVADAYPEVLEAALYVSKARGGYGAVREFCDYIMNMQAQKAGKSRGMRNECC